MTRSRPKPETETRKADLARFVASFSWLLLFLIGPTTITAQDPVDGLVRLAPSATGELVVDNRRGSITVEVWDEDAIGLVVTAEKMATKTARKKSPAQVERSERLLAITVAGARVGEPSHVDLKLFVPRTTRLKVSTSEGKLELSGATAGLVAQTISGDLHLNLPDPIDANIVAQSLNGTVTVSPELAELDASKRSATGQFRATWGGGSRTVNLFSGRGRIHVAKLAGRREPKAQASQAKQPRIADSQERETSGPVRKPPPQLPESPQEVDEDEVVRVDTDLVTLNVSVVDRSSGRGLAGLAQNDFKLYEDSVEQEISHFEASAAPFDLLLLIDLSGSTAKVTEVIRAAAQRFVDAARPQDRVSILAFTSDISVVSRLTGDRRALGEAIAKMAPPKGDTRLYDSLAEAITHFEREANASRRRAIVLMSDGLDSALPNVDGDGSSLPYAEVRDRVREFDGLLYTIWTSTEYEAFSPEDIQPETFDLAGDRMEELANEGGGAFYSVERMEDLAGAYERVVADLGTVFSLSYRPINRKRDGSWRTIRVRLPRHTDAVARGKRGYFAK